MTHVQIQHKSGLFVAEIGIPSMLSVYLVDSIHGLVGPAHI